MSRGTDDNPRRAQSRAAGMSRGVDVDTTKWSGEGAFTQVLIDHLTQLDGVTLVRVEDAPASRSEADYNFISNEIFVVFGTIAIRQRFRRFGLFPAERMVTQAKLDVAGLEAALDVASLDRRARLLRRKHAAVSENRTDRAALSDERIQARRAGQGLRRRRRQVAADDEPRALPASLVCRGRWRSAGDARGREAVRRRACGAGRAGKTAAHHGSGERHRLAAAAGRRVTCARGIRRSAARDCLPAGIRR